MKQLITLLSGLALCAVLNGCANNAYRSGPGYRYVPGQQGQQVAGSPGLRPQPVTSSGLPYQARPQPAPSTDYRTDNRTDYRTDNRGALAAQSLQETTRLRREVQKQTEELARLQLQISELHASPRVNPTEVHTVAQENAMLREQVELQASQVALLQEELQGVRSYVDNRSDAVTRDVTEIMAEQLAAQQAADRAHQEALLAQTRAAQTRAAQAAAAQTQAAAIGSTQIEPVTPIAVERPSSHRVASGENLTSIANRYGLGLMDLIRANQNIEPHRLRVGQVINIPGN